MQARRCRKRRCGGGKRVTVMTRKISLLLGRIRLLNTGNQLISVAIALLCSLSILIFLAWLNIPDRTMSNHQTQTVSFRTEDIEEILKPPIIEETIENHTEIKPDPFDLPAPAAPPISITAVALNSPAATLPVFASPVSEFPQFVAVAPETPVIIPPAVQTATATSDSPSTNTDKIVRPQKGINQGPIMIKPPNLKDFYPTRLRRSGTEGQTRFRLTISNHGRVTGVEILSSTPAGKFEKAARRLAKSLRFRPALRDGKPVTCRVQTKIDWKLR